MSDTVYNDNRVLSDDLSTKLTDIRANLVAATNIPIGNLPSHLVAIIEVVDTCIVLNDQRTADFKAMEEKLNPAFGR